MGPEDLNVKRVSIVVLISVLAFSCSTLMARTEVLPVANALNPAPGVIAAGRLKPDDIARLQQAQVQHVIDLTPDTETPDFDEATAVKSAGMSYSNLPLRGAADLTRENVIAFDQLMREAKRPVLVHCSSANRVGAMAALRAAWIDGKSEEDAISIGKAWGLKALEPDVRERIRSRAKSSSLQR